MEWDRARDCSSSVGVPSFGGVGVYRRHVGVLDVTSMCRKTGACCVVGRRAERAWGQESVAYRRASIGLCSHCIAVTVDSAFRWHPRAWQSFYKQLNSCPKAVWMSCAAAVAHAQSNSLRCANGSQVCPAACCHVSVLASAAHCLRIFVALLGTRVCADFSVSAPLPAMTKPATSICDVVKLVGLQCWCVCKWEGAATIFSRPFGVLSRMLFCLSAWQKTARV